jgi:hypothetical protein
VQPESKQNSARLRFLSVSKKGWRPAKQNLLSAPTKNIERSKRAPSSMEDNVQPEVVRTAV